MFSGKTRWIYTHSFQELTIDYVKGGIFLYCHCQSVHLALAGLKVCEPRGVCPRQVNRGTGGLSSYNTSANYSHVFFFKK